MKTQVDACEVCAPSKTDEIAILRDAARQLGPLSYCGPWLAEQLDGIERDIRSDYFPQVSRAATIAHLEALEKTARESAAECVAAANREAKAIRDKAIKDAEDIRAQVASQIYAAQRAIASW